MKKFSKRFASFIAAMTLIVLFAACSPMNTTSDEGEDQNNEEVEVPEEKDEEEKTDGMESEKEEKEKEDEEKDTDKEKEIPLTVYQADDQLMYLEKVNAILHLEDNNSEAAAFEELFSGKGKGNEEVFLFPEGTKINSLELNENNIVEIDLSNEFVNNMNVGSSGEQFYLQGLVNTLASYYKAEEVLLTIDGETYETGHYSLSEGETVSFDESLVED